MALKDFIELKQKYPNATMEQLAVMVGQKYGRNVYFDLMRGRPLKEIVDELISYQPKAGIGTIIKRGLEKGAIQTYEAIMSPLELLGLTHEASRARQALIRMEQYAPQRGWLARTAEEAIGMLVPMAIPLGGEAIAGGRIIGRLAGIAPFATSAAARTKEEIEKAGGSKSLANVAALTNAVLETIGLTYGVEYLGRLLGLGAEEVASAMQRAKLFAKGATAETTAAAGRIGAETFVSELAKQIAKKENISYEDAVKKALLSAWSVVPPSIMLSAIAGAFGMAVPMRRRPEEEAIPTETKAEEKPIPPPTPEEVVPEINRLIKEGKWDELERFLAQKVVPQETPIIREQPRETPPLITDEERYRMIMEKPPALWTAEERAFVQSYRPEVRITPVEELKPPTKEEAIPEEELILKKDGSPFKTKNAAMLRAFLLEKEHGIKTEPVEVKGGWALRKVSAELPKPPEERPPETLPAKEEEKPEVPKEEIPPREEEHVILRGIESKSKAELIAKREGGEVKPDELNEGLYKVVKKMPEIQIREEPPPIERPAQSEIAFTVNQERIPPEVEREPTPAEIAVEEVATLMKERNYVLEPINLQVIQEGDIFVDADGRKYQLITPEIDIGAFYLPKKKERSWISYRVRDLATGREELVPADIVEKDWRRLTKVEEAQPRSPISLIEQALGQDAVKAFDFTKDGVDYLILPFRRKTMADVLKQFRTTLEQTGNINEALKAVSGEYREKKGYSFKIDDNGDVYIRKEKTWKPLIVGTKQVNLLDITHNLDRVFFRGDLTLEDLFNLLPERTGLRTKVFPYTAKAVVRALDEYASHLETEIKELKGQVSDIESIHRQYRKIKEQMNRVIKERVSRKGEEIYLPYGWREYERGGLEAAKEAAVRKAAEFTEKVGLPYTITDEPIEVRVGKNKYVGYGIVLDKDALAELGYLVKKQTEKGVSYRFNPEFEDRIKSLAKDWKKALPPETVADIMKLDAQRLIAKEISVSLNKLYEQKAKILETKPIENPADLVKLAKVYKDMLATVNYVLDKYAPYKKIPLFEDAIKRVEEAVVPVAEAVASNVKAIELFANDAPTAISNLFFYRYRREPDIYAKVENFNPKSPSEASVTVLDDIVFVQRVGEDRLRIFNRDDALDVVVNSVRLSALRDLFHTWSIKRVLSLFTPEAVKGAVEEATETGARLSDIIPSVLSQDGLKKLVENLKAKNFSKMKVADWMAEGIEVRPPEVRAEIVREAPVITSMKAPTGEVSIDNLIIGMEEPEVEAISARLPSFVAELYGEAPTLSDVLNRTAKLRYEDVIKLIRDRYGEDIAEYVNLVMKGFADSGATIKDVIKYLQNEYAKLEKEIDRLIEEKAEVNPIDALNKLGLHPQFIYLLDGNLWDAFRREWERIGLGKATIVETASKVKGRKNWINRMVDDLVEIGVLSKDEVKDIAEIGKERKKTAFAKQRELYKEKKEIKPTTEEADLNLDALEFSVLPPDRIMAQLHALADWKKTPYPHPFSIVDRLKEPTEKLIQRYADRILGDLNIKVEVIDPEKFVNKLKELGVTEDRIVGALKLHGYTDEQISAVGIPELVKRTFLGATLKAENFIPLVFINENLNKASQIRAGIHELTEILIMHNRITDRDLRIIKREFGENWKEKFADSVADYILSEESLSERKRSLLGRIYDWFKLIINRFRSALAGDGFRSTQDIMRAIKEGKYALKSEIDFTSWQQQIAFSLAENPAIQYDISKERIDLSDVWKMMKSALGGTFRQIGKVYENYLMNPQWERSPFRKRLFDIAVNAHENTAQFVYDRLSEWHPLIKSIKKKSKTMYKKLTDAIIISDKNGTMLNDAELKRLGLDDDAIRAYKLTKQIFDEAIDKTIEAYQESIIRAYGMRLKGKTKGILIDVLKNDGVAGVKDLISAADVETFIRQFGLDEDSAADFVVVLKEMKDPIKQLDRQLKEYKEGYYFPRMRPGGRFAVLLFTPAEEGGIFEVARWHTNPSLFEGVEAKSLEALVGKLKKRYKNVVEFSKLGRGKEEYVRKQIEGKDLVIFRDEKDFDFYKNLISNQDVAVVSRITRLPSSMFENVSSAAMLEALKHMIERVSMELTGEDAQKFAKSLSKVIVEEVSDMLKERSLARSRFIRRRARAGTGVAVDLEVEAKSLPQVVEGYRTDLLDVVSDYMVAMGQHMSRLKATAEINDFVSSDRVRRILTENPDHYVWYKHYVKGVMSSGGPISQLAQRMKTLATVWFLGLRVSSGFIQLTQTLTTGVPELAPFIDADLAGIRAYIGKERPLTEVGAHAKRQAEAIRLNLQALKDIATGKMTAEERRALEEGLRRGSTLAQFTADMMAQANRIFGTLTPFVNLSLKPLQYFETKSRETGFLAAFRLARQKGASFEEAVDFADNYVNNSYFVFHKANRPIVALRDDGLGAVANVLTSLRGFELNYVGWIYRALVGEYGRRYADKVIASFLYTAILGGLFAIPGVDQLLKWIENATGKPLHLEIMKQFPEGPVREAMTYGILAPIFKVNLAPSLRLGLIPDELSLQGLSDMIFGVWRGSYFKVTRLKEAIDSREWTAILEAFAPFGIEKAVKGIEHIAGEPVRTASGKVLTDLLGRPVSLSTLESFLEIFGFSPPTTAKVWEERRAAKTILNYYQRKRNAIYRRLRYVRTADDLRKLMKQINEYNRSVMRYGGAVPFITATTIREQLMAGRMGRPQKLAPFLLR